MLKRLICTLLLVIALNSTQGYAEDTVDCFSHHKSQTSNFLAPVFDFTFASVLTPQSAISILGEAGPKTYRYGGTLGLFNGQNRFKISAEQLGQDLCFQFSTGKLHRWVHQYAVGGSYQFLFCNNLPTTYLNNFFKSVDVDVSYSRAMERNLSSINCSSTSPYTIGVINRQIAGARNAHFAAGVTVTPWKWADVSACLDWDSTLFGRKSGHDEKINGFGGSVRLFQRLPYNLNCNVDLQFRRPFNYYEASFGWGGVFNNSLVDIKFYGSYTQANNNVPNVGTLGISFNVAFNGPPLFSGEFFQCNTCTQCPCDYAYFDSCGWTCLPRIYDSELLAWISEPAVYMPVVLAKASESLTVISNTPPPPPPPPCTAPTSIAFIVGQSANSPYTFNVGNNWQFNAGPNFSGSNLVFSISPITIGGATFSINPSTGLVTASGSVSQPATLFTITATNSCGSTSQAIYFQYNAPG